jgi:hypothetical protein
VVIVVAAGAAAAWRAGVFSPAASSGTGLQGAPPPATSAVVREDLSATTPLSATLGYASTYPVTGQGGGTLTWLPSPGPVISQGKALYRTDDDNPVVLLYGSVPDWRDLTEGVTGQDVSQLNHDLVQLGYASSSDIAALGWDYYSWATTEAVQRLEAHLGVASPPGTLSLGLVVFEPEALRVSQLIAHLGGQANGAVLTATSGRHVVTISLDVSAQSQVTAGDAVSVSLPNGATASGLVSEVGTVATTADGQNGSSTTIQVQVKLTDPRAAGTLDQAPVTVYVTTDSARNVLAVPVTALLARSPGGYDVEVVGPGSARSYVPVTPGLFDDNSGMVQVTGALVPGERVVVAAS